MATPPAEGARRRTCARGARAARMRAKRLFGSRIVARARRLGAYIEAQLKPPSERTEAERQPPPEYLMREIGTITLDIKALTAPK